METLPEQREIAMAMFEGEPALSEVLLDPIILAVMKSDGVDCDWFRTLLKKAARAEPGTANSAKSSSQVRRSYVGCD